MLSTTDPYFTINGISNSVDLFYRTSRPLNSQGEEYELVTLGGSTRFGIPFSEFDTVFFGIGVERTKIEGDVALPLTYIVFRERYGDSSTSVPLTIGWARDGRDSALVPTEGKYQRANLEWSPGGNSRYVRLNAQYQQYIPFFRSFTLGLNAEVGYGKGLGGREFPVFKNFTGGGLGTVRAFDQGSLGPVDPIGAYIGGNRRLNLNAELYLPVPGTGNDKTLRVFGYLDAGNVWGEKEKITGDSIRASAGVGLTWVSPVGPLKLSWGRPIRKDPKDRIQPLQFQIGTAF